MHKISFKAFPNTKWMQEYIKFIIQVLDKNILNN